MSEWLPVLTAVAGGGVGSAVTALSTKKKVAAETINVQVGAANEVTETALKMVAELRSQVEQLHLEMKAMQTQMAAMQEDLDRCEEGHAAARVRIQVLEEEVSRYKVMSHE